jgi:hypothetical protein
MVSKYTDFRVCKSCVTSVSQLGYQPNNKGNLNARVQIVNALTTRFMTFGPYKQLQDAHIKVRDKCPSISQRVTTPEPTNVSSRNRALECSTYICLHVPLCLKLDKSKAPKIKTYTPFCMRLKYNTRMTQYF